MVEISRDGKRVYFTNSLYGAIDSQLYSDGLDGWMVKLDAKPEGGLAFDPKFFLAWPKGRLPHQIRLQGGDCSENFDDCESAAIAGKLKILLQMSLVLVQGSKKRVIRVGRIAGQYAKPRSADTETRAGSRCRVFAAI